MGKLTELSTGIEMLRNPPPQREPEPEPTFGDGELEWLVAEALQASLDKIAAEIGKGHGKAIEELGKQIKTLTTEMMKSSQAANKATSTALEKMFAQARKAADQKHPGPKIPAPIVNVQVPQEEPTSWTFDIERDNRGFLKTVIASPGPAQ